MPQSYLLGVVLLSNNEWWESSIRLVPVPSSPILLLCLVVPLFPYITQDICRCCRTRQVVLRNQLQHSLLKGFIGSQHCQNATGVVGQSSHTSAFFLPLLHNLLLLGQLQVKSWLGQWESWLLILLPDLVLLEVFHTRLRCLLLGTTI